MESNGNYELEKDAEYMLELEGMEEAEMRQYYEIENYEEKQKEELIRQIRVAQQEGKRLDEQLRNRADRERN